MTKRHYVLPPLDVVVVPNPVVPNGFPNVLVVPNPVVVAAGLPNAPVAPNPVVDAAVLAGVPKPNEAVQEKEFIKI